MVDDKLKKPCRKHTWPVHVTARAPFSCVVLHKGPSGRNLLRLSGLAWSQSFWKGNGWQSDFLPFQPAWASHVPLTMLMCGNQRGPYRWLCCGLRSIELNLPVINNMIWLLGVCKRAHLWCFQSGIVTIEQTCYNSFVCFSAFYTYFHYIGPIHSIFVRKSDYSITEMHFLPAFLTLWLVKVL